MNKRIYAVVCAICVFGLTMPVYGTQPSIDFDQTNFNIREIMDQMGDETSVLPIPYPADADYTDPAPEIIKRNTTTVLARIDMNSEMDRYLRTDVTFKTAKGRVVYVAINGVWKCPDGKCPDIATDWGQGCSYNESIIFRTDDGRLFSAGIEQITNYSIVLFPIRKGHKDIYFDGDNRPYTVKLYVRSLNATGVKNAVLKITTKGRLVFKTTIAKTLYGIIAKTTPVKMSCKFFTFVGRTLYENKDGDCCFGLNANLVLIPEPTEEDHYIYPIPVSLITPEGIRCRLDWKYSLRRVDGNVLEIYRP